MLPLLHLQTPLKILSNADSEGFDKEKKEEMEGLEKQKTWSRALSLAYYTGVLVGLYSE